MRAPFTGADWISGCFGALVVCLVGVVFCGALLPGPAVGAALPSAILLGAANGYLTMRERRRWRERERVLLGRCGRCGYNLKGNVSGACPECGTARTTPE